MNGESLVRNLLYGHRIARVFGQVMKVAVSYTHLRAHETVLDLVCRLLLEKTNMTDTSDTVKSEPAADSRPTHMCRVCTLNKHDSMRIRTA